MVIVVHADNDWDDSGDAASCDTAHVGGNRAALLGDNGSDGAEDDFHGFDCNFCSDAYVYGVLILSVVVEFAFDF